MSPAEHSSTLLSSPLVLASRNEGKLRELRPLIEAAGFRGETLVDVGIPESAEEDALEVHDTFEANALAKARWFAALLPGRAVLADDSGLAVDALHGAPGVRSKRWSNRPELMGAALDEANNAMLLDALETVGAREGAPRAATGVAGSGNAGRTARYVCAAACIWPDARGGREFVAHGETGGVILSAPRGSGGFGYDPYFLSDELGATFAEVSREAKGAVSHRGRAFAELFRLIDAAILRRPVDPAEQGG
ncbi:MAG: non-canonical purine NTP pyrophosphatase [Gemmatimonadota bacterium]